MRFGELCAEWVGTGTTTTCYVLVPESLGAEWLSAMAAELSVNMVSVRGYSWDDDLTPWPMGPVMRDHRSFGGHAPHFLGELKDLCERVEEDHANATHRRVLAGVSLSGLFAVWAMAQDDFFGDVVSVSGSFWYEGFATWLEEKEIRGEGRRAYLSVGAKESRSRNKYFKTVGEKTETVASRLAECGVTTTLQRTTGDHGGDISRKMSEGIREVLKRR